MAWPLEDEDSGISHLCNSEYPDLNQAWLQTEKRCSGLHESSAENRNKGNISDNKACKRTLFEQNIDLRAVFSKSMIQ
jgi:hypothetical protein